MDPARTDEFFDIMLDIDGVLMPDRTRGGALGEAIWASRQKLMSVEMYGELRWRVAQAEHMSPEAIANMHALLKHIESRGLRPRIIISSQWRDDCTVPEFRELIFKAHGLSQYIVDATVREFRIPEEEVERRRQFLRSLFEEQEPQSWCESDRGYQIWIWQRGYGTSLVASKRYLVFDDCVTDAMASLFKSRMIKTSMHTLFDDVALAQAIASVDEQCNTGGVTGQADLAPSPVWTSEEEQRLLRQLENIANHLNARDLPKKLLQPILRSVSRLHHSRFDVKFERPHGVQWYGYQTHKYANRASVGPQFISWEQWRSDGLAPSRTITTAEIYVSKHHLAREPSSELPSSDVIDWQIATPTELEEFIVRIIGSQLAPPR